MPTTTQADDEQGILPTLSELKATELHHRMADPDYALALSVQDCAWLAERAAFDLVVRDNW